MLSTKKCYCPYCGERIEMVVDLSEAQQSYIEDCFVCCRPINVDVSVEGDEVTVEVKGENDV
jgi:hypothetical protein